MGEIRFVGTGETRGYPNPVCKKLLSCILDKDIRVFYLDRQFLFHPLSHPGPDKNHVCLMDRLYRKSGIYVVK